MLPLPFITVVIRSYNRALSINHTIESVISQDISPHYYQILVIDDGSTDNTKAFLASYQDNVKVIYSKHQGAIPALNLGLHKVTTPYYMVMDSDDLMESQALRLVYEAMNDCKGKVIVYSDYFETFQNRKERQVIHTKHEILHTVAGGIAYPTAAVMGIGGYDAHMFFAEYDVLLRLLTKYTLVHIPIPLFTYIRHPLSLTHDKEAVKLGIKQLEVKYPNLIYKIRNYLYD